MSWLGKILAFLVLIGAVLWAAMTVNVYATRTNWKARADTYEKAFKESEELRRTEQRTWESQKAALSGQLAAERDQSAKLNTDLAALSALSKKGDEDYKKLTATVSDLQRATAIRDANLTATLAELKDTRDRYNELQDGATKLVLDREAANRARVQAEGDAKAQAARADDNAKRVLELTEQLAQARQTGGAGGTAAVLRSVERTPAPLPDNTRGTVLRDISGDFVQISLGIDAGLEPGSRLDVYRESTGQYLGELVVTKSLYPKESVAEFKPARAVPVGRLRVDELPRKGDTVGIVANSPTGRNR